MFVCGGWRLILHHGRICLFEINGEGIVLVESTIDQMILFFNTINEEFVLLFLHKNTGKWENRF